MQLQRLWLTDFRSYPSAELAFAPGLTALLGANGEGKTNVLEAVAYLATLSSFRGAPNDALVRHGCQMAVVRAEGEREGRSLLVEAEITTSGRGRVQVNKQRLSRARDLLGALRVSVFSPDDLELVKGGPAERRRYLDDTLVARLPKLDLVRSDLDRVLRQRNALLKQSGGRLTPEVDATLGCGTPSSSRRGRPWPTPGPPWSTTWRRCWPRPTTRWPAGPPTCTVRYEAPWREHGLAAALEAARKDELRRGLSLVGPHRDELALTLDGMPARTHASQGEQRSVALALRLAAHRVVTEATGSPPILLLDDVFSELDPERSAALLAHLPAGQTLLSSAAGLPAGRRARAGAAGRGRRGHARPDAGAGPAVAGGPYTRPMPWEPLPGSRDPEPARVSDSLEPPGAPSRRLVHRREHLAGAALARPRGPQRGGQQPPGAAQERHTHRGRRRPCVGDPAAVPRGHAGHPAAGRAGRRRRLHHRGPGASRQPPRPLRECPRSALSAGRMPPS